MTPPKKVLATRIKSPTLLCPECRKAKGTNIRCATCERFSHATDIRLRFGERLRQLRESAGMTQNEMATKFGMDRSYLSDIETGTATIRLPMIEVVALGLQISLSTLFRGL